MVRAAVLAAVALAALACSSDGDGGSASTGVAVAVVADSEIPAEVADLLGADERIRIAEASSTDGATMAELDPAVERALDDDPAVLVYAGGTNDLPAGPLVMLEGLEDRLTRWVEQVCVVVAVPIFRYERGTPEEVAAQTRGTRLLEDAVVATGARAVSYLDISLAMDAAGEDFFAEGELGDLHPGPAAYERIAAALADEVAACE